MNLRLEKLPLVGGLSVTFPDIPEFSWTWTGSAGLGIRSIAATLDQASDQERVGSPKTRTQRCGDPHSLVNLNHSLEGRQVCKSRWVG